MYSTIQTTANKKIRGDNISCSLNLNCKELSDNVQFSAYVTSPSPCPAIDMPKMQQCHIGFSEMLRCGWSCSRELWMLVPSCTSSFVCGRLQKIYNDHQCALEDCKAFLWHNNPMPLDHIPADVQTSFVIRHTMSQDPNPTQRLCAEPDCCNAHNQPHAANKACQKNPLRCAQCCRAAGGCRLKEHHIKVCLSHFMANAFTHK